jgi:glycosyltransferase involved in cell wall biosynthesis
VRNILFLHTTSEIGGSDVSLVRLIEQLNRRAFAPVVVLPADGPLVPRLTAAGARVFVLPALLKLTSRRGRAFLARFALNYPWAVWRLVRLIRRERVALVHTNTIHNLYGFAAARLAGVPHVWHIREIVWQSGALRRLELWLARRWSTRIIVTSDAVAGMFGPRAAWPAQLVKVPNGVETDRFSPGDGSAVHRELGAAPGQPIVGIVCRLDVWKGVDVFLDAAARVAATDAAVRFAVVGGPIVGLDAYESELKAQAARLGVSDRVCFTGWRFGPEMMPDVHRALAVLVLASVEPEPFGLVLLEAMATATPVIATAAGGPIEICVDGETGLLVPPRDAAALARAITALVRDPARAHAMGEAGRRRVLACYSAERYVAGIEAVYRSVLAAS